jgi:hypothetical protein
MKRIYLFNLLPILVLLLLVGCEKSSSDWVSYYLDEDTGGYSYQKVNKDGDIVQVWDQQVYSIKGRANFINLVRDSKLSTEGLDKLSYNNVLMRIDCKKRMIQQLSIYQYDTDGKLLHATSDDNPKWVYLVPDSRGDILRKKVCE